MAVVFPTENDRDILLAYIKKVHLKHDDDTGTRSASISGILFQPEHVLGVERACDFVLVNLRKLKCLFTAGRPLVSRETPDAFEAGDLEPFSSVSLADTFFWQSPSVFFNPSREILETMRTELVSSRDAMKRINAENAFIWTSDVSTLQEWSRGGAYQGAEIVEKPDAQTPAGEASALEGDRPGLSDAFLLSLKAEEIPSAMVKSSYAKFIQACASLIGWLSTVLEILNGVGEVPRPGKFNIPEGESHDANACDRDPLLDASAQASTQRTRTVTVRCFEIHDAYQIYALFIEQAAYFFKPDCTQYDARVQRLLLQSSYFHSIRELIDELTIEIDRLKRIAQQKPLAMAKNSNLLLPYDLYAHNSEAQHLAPDERVRIFFRPSLSYFCFLRASLQLYLSICLNEDDLTSLLYFENLYKIFLAEARDVAHSLQRLQTPCLGVSDAREASENPFLFLSTDARAEGASPMAERGQLEAMFAAYRNVCEKIHSLMRTIENDIRSKDSTHRTQVLTSSVQGEKGPALLEAEQNMNAFANRGDQQPKSFWTATKYSFGKLSHILTSQATFDFNLYDQFVGNIDGEGIPMTATSPCHDGKTEVLKNVKQLWKVMEIQGAQLEKKYPKFFFRGSKSRLVKLFKNFAKKAEAVSTVFEH